MIIENKQVTNNTFSLRKIKFVCGVRDCPESFKENNRQVQFGSQA